MNLAADIQKIERDKWLKRHQELRKIASPIHQKINMRKVKLDAHPKSHPKSKHNQLEERNGEDASKRMVDLTIDPPESTSIWPIEESDEALLELNLVEEPYLVEI